MAPSAIFYPPSTPIQEPSPTTVLKGSALVIGSLSTAQDGRYQSVLESLEHRDVERQLVDRLVDGATALPPSNFSTVYVILAPDEYETLAPRLPSFLSTLLSTLTPLGLLHISNLATSLGNLPSELTLSGFTIVSNRDESGVLIAQKPSFTQGASVSLKQATQASALVPRLTLNPALKSSKQALWTISSPATTPIDPESLLTPEDHVRPDACELMTKGGPWRKKACKGCTCGLAELEEEERLAGKIVVLDGAEGGGTKEIVVSEKEKLATSVKASSKATSSCGSCFLGDAFRCASCPYLGLPAFRPGEKVEIDLASDDF